MVYIERDACKGCGICMALCPIDILEFSSSLNARGVPFPEIKDESRCTGCENCMIYCPDFAVVVVKDEERKRA